MKFKAIIPAHVASDCYLAVSSDETRVQLHGFNLSTQAGKLWAAGCDGTHLIAINLGDYMHGDRAAWSVLPSFSLIRLPAKVLAVCRKGYQRMSTKFFLRIWDSGCDVVPADDARHAIDVPDTYAEIRHDEPVITTETAPDWRRCIPSGGFTTDSVVISGKALDHFARLFPLPGPGCFLRHYKASNRLSLQVRATGDVGCPAIVTVGGRPDALCVVMPVRGDAHGRDPRIMLQTTQEAA